MKNLRVDLGMLEMAFEDAGGEHHHVLDTETGECLIVREYGEDETEIEIQRSLDGGEERYLIVPSADSHNAYEDIEDFIGTVEDKVFAARLSGSIQGRGAFRRFKDVLRENGAEEKRWFEFKQERTRAKMCEWLVANGIELIKPETAQ
ncbi:MAG: hypothetical protein HQL23_03700 [Candidatus Omnitrophica bacterium]|nr:hypothetical protein [Candidatus Omnitrophota bacterium]